MSQFPPDLSESISKAFLGHHMQETSSVWVAMSHRVPPAGMTLMKLLWPSWKRWLRGGSYRNPAHTSQARYAYIKYIHGLQKVFREDHYNLPWSYHKFAAPLTKNWGPYPETYYGKLCIQLPEGLVTFLEPDPSFQEDNSGVRLPEEVILDDVQTMRLLKFFQNLEKHDLTTKAPMSLWDHLEN